MCVISLCTRGALDRWSRGGSTAALGAYHMQPRDLSHDLRRLVRDGVALDTALSTLRADGASIIECIAAVRWVRGCDLAEAKRIVHTSPAWSDVAAQNAEFHEELEALARELK